MPRALMMIPRSLLAALVALTIATPARSDDGWIDLTGTEGFASWKPPHADWTHVVSVRPDPKNPKRLTYESGKGDIIVNGPIGLTKNIITTRAFGDVELRFDFMVPKGSNSGVKFECVYEIQIADSFGVKTPKASDCGGIYPRAELLPRYHHIDEGTPPTSNPSKAPGEWQTFDIIFHAPRFDADGKKIANARIVKAVLNGVTVQDNVELKTPTGHVWRDKEKPTGPLLIQADHGPVAFRKIQVRPITSAD